MNFSNNRICQLFNIQYPIVQAGMIWCSGWRLASAVSNAGGLGIIGAGSMYPDVLRSHLKKCKGATDKPFGVNVPLLYPDIDKLMNIIVEEGVKIVFTSAGNPALWTQWLKERGMTVVHVISSSKFAEKCEKSGVDALVAEGFEAGGHNGREETTTLVLIPAVRRATQLPLIAAGGIATGSQMLAAFALGAEGVQVGSRFASVEESSAHENFKQAIVAAKEGDTILTLKEITPVRLIKNEFYQKVKAAEDRGASKLELIELLGRARAKRGIFEGDIIEGELEIGQVSALINKEETAASVIQDMLVEFEAGKAKLAAL
jgi:enoyl-[acyl-carrier protein] reductase II